MPAQRHNFNRITSAKGAAVADLQSAESHTIYTEKDCVDGTESSCRNEKTNWLSWPKSLDLCNFFGRGERIRTFDPLHPMQVRYQAAPRPDKRKL